MRVGVDGRTGGVLTSWAHCQQSLEQIFTTAVGTRCMRRDLGTEVPRLQDRPANTRSFVLFVGAIARGCKLYEPGFRLTKVVPVTFGAAGVAGFEVRGDFYEDGHLGVYGRPTPVRAGYTAAGLLAPLALGGAPA